jgi:hypothetical protein
VFDADVQEEVYRFTEEHGFDYNDETGDPDDVTRLLADRRQYEMSLAISGQSMKINRFWDPYLQSMTCDNILDMETLEEARELYGPKIFEYLNAKNIGHCVLQHKTCKDFMEFMSSEPHRLILFVMCCHPRRDDIDALAQTAEAVAEVLSLVPGGLVLGEELDILATLYSSTRIVLFYTKTGGTKCRIIQSWLKIIG